MVGLVAVGTCKPMRHVPLSTFPTGLPGRRWQLVGQCVTIRCPPGVKGCLLETCMPGRKRPRNTVARRLAVVTRKVPESHSAVVSGVDVSENRADIGVREVVSASLGTDRADFPTVVQRNKGSASDLEVQLASGSSRVEARIGYERGKHAFSAHASHSSLLATLTKFLRAWLGPTVHHTRCTGAHLICGRRFEGAGLSQFFQLHISGQRKHMLQRGIPGPHCTNWKQHKVHVLSHEVGGCPTISPVAR